MQAELHIIYYYVRIAVALSYNGAHEDKCDVNLKKAVWSLNPFFNYSIIKSLEQSSLMETRVGHILIMDMNASSVFVVWSL